MSDLPFQIALLVYRGVPCAEIDRQLELPRTTAARLFRQISGKSASAAGFGKMRGLAYRMNTPLNGDTHPNHGDEWQGTPAELVRHLKSLPQGAL